MMELKVSEWKEFRLDRLFSIRRGDRIVKNEDYFNEPADDTYVYPVVTASATNNGVDGLYNKSNCEGHCIVSCGEANGMFTTWQARPFWGMDTVRIYQPIGFTMTERKGVFFATLLSHNMYRFSYGRKAKPDNMYTLFLRLPIQHDASGLPLIDPLKKYSDDGYVPDWNFMEQYMKALNTQPLVTKRDGAPVPALEVDRWKEFQVGRFFKAERGMRHIAEDRLPGNIPYYSASQDNNGLTDMISNPLFLSENALIFSTFGDCYYVKGYFTASDEMTILTCDGLTESVGLFLATVLSQSKYKFAFGRKAFQNKLLDEWFRLPVQQSASGNPVIDSSKKYSDDGYIPDWAFMEQYIGSLPGSDLV